jgi:hypothetical protein
MRIQHMSTRDYNDLAAPSIVGQDSWLRPNPHDPLSHPYRLRMIEISIRSFTEPRAEASGLSRTQAKEGVPSGLCTGRGIAVLSAPAAPGPLAEPIGQQTRSNSLSVTHLSRLLAEHGSHECGAEAAARLDTSRTAFLYRNVSTPLAGTQLCIAHNCRHKPDTSAGSNTSRPDELALQNRTQTGVCGNPFS